MPYLHWDLQAQQVEMQRIMDKTKEDRTVTRQRILEAPDLKDPKGTEKLYWVYLDEKHPLHVRRTLDQYYYHTLPNTEERDKDQTGIRYHDKHLKWDNRDLKPVLTMVDQLWMWVLPACGKSPPTIITAFPQRCNRITETGTKHTTALVYNIISNFRETSEWSADGLARVIATECSRIYFDTMSNRNESLQFSEIYTTSIGEIVSNSISPPAPATHPILGLPARVYVRVRETSVLTILYILRPKGKLVAFAHLKPIFTQLPGYRPGRCPIKIRRR
jgi:hypothetical protein